MARFPFSPYPNGWYRVAYSDEIPKGGVQPLHYFGKDLVLFRTQSGTAQVFDAHCPHLGAHLGYGGRITEEAIVCPFHGWQFGATGECLAVPGSVRRGSKAKLQDYPVCEANGLILVYYDSLRKAPAWEIPALPEWHPQHWSPFLRRTWKIRTHPQEMAENALDTAHMLWLHGQSFKAVTETHLDINGATLTHRLHPKYRLAIAGEWGIDATGVAEISCHGLGCQISYTGVKALIEFQSLALFWLTPIDGEVVDVHILVSTKQVINPLITRWLCHKSMAEISYNLEQDIPIWENKIYRSQPILSENDGPIPAYRRWAQQFYYQETSKN